MKNYTLSKYSIIFIVLVLLVQSTFRVYFFQDHLFFEEEQARDYTVVQTAWEEKGLIYLGPIQAETKGIKLGPLYYYLLAPGLIISNFHPITGTILVSIFWLITLGLIFIYVYKRISPSLAVFFVVFLSIQINFFLFTTIPLNTGIIFLFEAIFLICLFEWIYTKKPLCFIGTIFALACLLQSHLSAFLLLPFLATIHWVYRKNVSRKMLLSYLILPFSYIPVLLFDITHQFKQSKIFYNFVFLKHSVETNEQSFTVFNAIKVWLISSLISHDALVFYKFWWFDIAIWIIMLLIAGLIVHFLLHIKPFSLTAVYKKIKAKHTFVILTFFTLLFLFGNTIIQSSKPRHYLLLFFIPYLVLAVIFSKYWNKALIYKLIISIGMLLFLAGNIYNYKSELNLQNDFNSTKNNEGFSNRYQERNQLAKSIAEYINSSPYSYKIATSDSDSSLHGVLNYLVMYHSNFGAALVKKNEKPDRILYITSQSQPSIIDALIVSSEHMYVYELKRNRYNTIKDHIE